VSSCQIFDAQEREETTVPISELWDGGNFEILPEVLGRGYFQIRFARDRLVLCAGDYVGLIPLNQRVVINVQPRLPVRNLLRVVSRAKGRIHSLEFFRPEYEASEFQAPVFLQVIACSFLSQLRRIQKEGLLKAYVQEDTSTPPLRGRILFNRSAQRFWSIGLKHRADVSFYDLTPDVPLNQLLCSAVKRILRQLQIARQVPRQLLRGLVEFEDVFTELGIREINPGDIASARLAARKSPNIAHREAAELAALILEGQGVKLPAGAGGVRLPSFLLNMADIFESYIRESLKTHLSPPFQVMDGNREGSKSLFDEGAAPLATPDIVVYEGARPVLVCDVKYKLKVEREDLNQVLTYALCYKVPKALVLYLSSTSELKKMGTVGRIEAYCYSFALSAEDLDLEEDRVASTLSTLCSPSQGA
jgi:5-methylcytosine-specific restriction enzyme subunit McrC